MWGFCEIRLFDGPPDSCTVRVAKEGPCRFQSRKATANHAQVYAAWDDRCGGWAWGIARNSNKQPVNGTALREFWAIAGRALALVNARGRGGRGDHRCSVGELSFGGPSRRGRTRENDHQGRRQGEFPGLPGLSVVIRDLSKGVIK